MKLRCRWESELTPDEVRMRIRRKAKRMDKGWRWKADVFCYDFPDEAHFKLIRTGRSGAGGGQCPFTGTIEVRDGKTFLSGWFRPGLRETGIFLVICAVFLLAAVVGNGAALLIGSLPVVLLWFVLMFGLTRLAHALFFKERNRAVIEFIETRLLRR